MTDKDNIRAEIEAVKLIIQANRAQGAFAEGYLLGQESVVEHLEKFIDSMPKEQVSEDLERAAMNYTVEIKGFPGIADETDKKVLKAFKAGWQAGQEQMMKDANILKK